MKTRHRLALRQSLLSSLGICVLGGVSAPVLAQDARQSDGAHLAGEDMGGEGEEIIVQGGRLPGAVMGDIKPEQQMSPADVRALGVSSISELLTELAPQTNAAGGSPVVLLNGKRISSFSEIQDLPTEAIMRVDILPEEVALTYGYAPTQKVVNIVLRRRFRAETVDLRGGTTTDGGRENGSGEGGILRIRGDNRFTLNLKYSAADDLLESERGIQPTTPSRPYALGGNVTALTSGQQIDPALSALAGTTVTIAGVPASAATGAPLLSDFVAGANSQTVSNLSDYRTLSPATQEFTANAVYARAFGDISMSLNGRLQMTDSDSLQGLPSTAVTLPAANPFSPFGTDVSLYRYLDQAGALKQDVSGRTGHLGLTLNGGLMPKWQWSFTGNADLARTSTNTDRGFSTAALQSAITAGDPAVNPFGTIADGLLTNRLRDSARSETRSVGGDLLLTGQLFALPAGGATTSIRLGASAEGASSNSLRSGLYAHSEYAREIASGQFSLDLPLTSRSRNVLGAIGDLGVNFNAASRHLSDFGTLSTLGYGLRWTPIKQIRLIASASQDRAAPTGTQITDPLVTTPNVSVFDYVRGESVFITQLSGGNAALKASVRDQFRLSATVKPLEKANLTLTATYLHSKTTNPIASFPTATAALEAAFPQRFMRDADGRLLQIDARPINFLEAENSQLRWGMDISIPLKSSIQKKMEAWRAAGSKPEDRPADMRALFGNRGPGGENGQPPAGGEGQNRDGQNRDGPSGDRGGQGGGPGGGGPGAGGPPGGGFGGGGFGGPRGPGGGGGRLQFSVYHTWRFTDSILIASGMPRLDLLNGDATGSSGGQPRHELEGRVGYFNNGLGARLSVNWESATHVDGALNGTSRLDFGSLATADLRLFANLGQMPSLVKAHPFLRGSRVTLSVTNVLNERRSVTDATGGTPVRYQPNYLDPLGRAVVLSFRKLFF